MVLIAIVTGAYKPTYNWGASHCSESQASTQLSKRNKLGRGLLSGEQIGVMGTAQSRSWKWEVAHGEALGTRKKGALVILGNWGTHHKIRVSSISDGFKPKTMRVTHFHGWTDYLKPRTSSSWNFPVLLNYWWLLLYPYNKYIYI